MWVSGLKKASDTAKACKSGRTGQSTKGTGRTTWLTVKEDLYILMETSTRASGSTTKRMAGVFISIWTGQNIAAIGEKINSTGSGWRPGQTGQGTRGIMSMGKSTALGHLSGPIKVNILVSSTTTTSTGGGSILGVMAVDTKASGRVTKCMGRAPSPGPMEGGMWESMWTTRNKAMGNSSGLTAAHTRATGIMENNMAEEFMLLPKAQRNTENGKKEKESAGSAEMTRAESCSCFNIPLYIH